MAKNIEAIKKKEAKELEKWQLKNNKGRYAGFFIVLLVLTTLARVLDAYSTNVTTSLQTAIVNEFYVQGQGMDFAAGLSQYSLIVTGLLIFSVLATIYISLADKYGRKPLLVISIIGMTAGMFICYLSTNLMVHIIGRAVISFFIAQDIHQLYMMEIAPKEKRASYMAAVAFFGYLSVMLISVSRGANTVGNELVWRNTFIVPVIAGIVLTVLMIVFGRESKVFLDTKINYLSKPYEERQAEAKAKNEKAKSGGLGMAFKFIFRHKQPRNLLLASIAQMIAIMAFFGFYEAIMTTSGMTTDQVTNALFIYPITCAVSILAIGLISDKFGRKTAGVVSSVTAFVGLVAFILAAKNLINPYIVGLLYGIEIGCFWAYGNQLILAFGETIPTRIRSSSIAARGIIAVVISLVSGVIISALVKVFPLGALCLVWGAVTLGVSIVMFALMVKETKGTNLEEVVAD
jgi:MFS family permease